MSNPITIESSQACGWQPPALEELQTEFSAYEIIGLIGVGGMGAVYQARQLSLDRMVAIKILPPDLQDGAAARQEQFTNEARALGRLTHPHIISVHDSGITPGGLHFLCMEFFNGFTLHEKITSEKRLTGAAVLTLMPPICDALHYAHTHGVIHRDIKPENILINHSGQIRVADFGLARLQDIHGNIRPEVEMGSPDYTAPEIYNRESVIDGRADIYSLGIMLHQMLTGSPLRAERVPASQLVQSDPGFDPIILKATALDPAHRYTTAAEMKSDLERITSRRSGPVRILPVLQPTGSPTAHGTAAASSQKENQLPVSKKRHALRTVIGITAAVTAAVSAAAALFFPYQETPKDLPPTESPVSAEEISNPFGDGENVLADNHPIPAQTQTQTASRPDKPSSLPTSSKTIPPLASPIPAQKPVAPPAADNSKPTEKPSPIITGKTSRYQFQPSDFNWENALKSAQAAGGQLACITSREELEFVGKNVISPRGLKPGTVWIGGRADVSNQWTWISGEPFTSQDLWLPDQPSIGVKPTSGGFPGYLCIAKKDGLWGLNDLSDTAHPKTHWKTGNRGYLVEYPLEPSAPSPSTPGSPSINPGAHPAKVAIPPALQSAEANFRKALETEVLSSWRKACAALQSEYLTNVERALRTATQSGNLNEALAFDHEKKRLTAQEPLPPTDPPDLPGALRTLRNNWRTKSSKIQQDHERKIRPLYEKYLTWLTSRVTELTRQNKLPEARLIQDHYNHVATEPTLPSPGSNLVPAPQPATTPTSR